MTSRLRPSSAKLLFLSRVRLVVTMKLSNTPSTSVTWRKGRKLRRPIAVDQVAFRASRHVGRIHRYLADALFSTYLTSAYSMSPRSRLTSLSRRVGKHGSFRLWGSTTSRCIPPTNWPTESCHCCLLPILHPVFGDGTQDGVLGILGSRAHTEGSGWYNIRLRRRPHDGTGWPLLRPTSFTTLLVIHLHHGFQVWTQRQAPSGRSRCHWCLGLDPARL